VVFLLVPDDWVTGSSIESLIGQATKDQFTGVPAVKMVVGDSLSVPFGVVPIVLALPSSVLASSDKTPKKAGRQPKATKADDTGDDEFCVFTLTPAFSLVDASLRSPATCNRVATEWTNCHSSVPKAYRESSNVQAWRKALSEATCKEEDGDGH